MSSSECAQGDTVLDDIEDLILTAEDAPVSRLERTDLTLNSQIQQKRRRRQETLVLTSDDNETINQTTSTNGIKNEEMQAESNIPGMGTVYVKTWGCAHNNSDGEYMAGLLSEYGYNIVLEDEESNQADVWVLNSCSVKGPAEAHFVNTIADAQKQGKKIVIAGCVPQAWGTGPTGQKSMKNAKATDLSIIGVQQIDRVVEVVEETMKGNTVRLMGTKIGKVESNDSQAKKIKLGGARLDLPKIRKNPLVEIVPISTGCLNQCTYCKTKHARGHLGSYPIEEIVDRIKQVVSEGVLEIWLTSEDTGAYGRDLGTNITELLWRILEVLPEPVMLRMGMTNPPYIQEHIHEMAKIYEHPRIYAYLHMPIQSASDTVLERMKREYTRKDFETIVDYLKQKVPHLNVATDLIIGFPGETHEEYRHTWDLVQKYQFSVLFINQFYPRPGTPAAKMTRVPTNEVKDRTRELSAWFKNFMPYEGRKGEIHRILVTEVAPDGVHVAGRTKSYEMVLVENTPGISIDDLMGRVVEVEIIETGKFFLKGKPTEDGINNLQNQPLPSNTVLRNRNVLSKGRKQINAENDLVKKERLDYHEGDDGEDYEEEDLDGSDCGDQECGDCSDQGCGDCGTTSKPEQSTTNQSTSSTASATTIGPSAPIQIKKQVQTQQKGSSNNQLLLGLFVVLFAVLLINYPWLKRYFV